MRVHEWFVGFVAVISIDGLGLGISTNIPSCDSQLHARERKHVRGEALGHCSVRGDALGGAFGNFSEKISFLVSCLPNLLFLF